MKGESTIGGIPCLSTFGVYAMGLLKAFTGNKFYLFISPPLKKSSGVMGGKAIFL